MIHLKTFSLLVFLLFILTCCIQENKNHDEVKIIESTSQANIDTLLLSEKTDTSSFIPDNPTMTNKEETSYINEDSCWRETKKINTICSYETYLINFPKGKYKKNAKNALKKLVSNTSIQIDSTIIHKKDFPITKTTEGYKGTYIKYTDERDGNTYNVVKIGELLWFAENLRYQPNEGKFWAYDNNPYAVDVYGYLYDWETALEVCPKTWRLPEDKDWSNLEHSIGKRSLTASALKSANNWKNNSISSSNSTGFSAIPAGIRTESGNFVSQNAVSFWWTATELNKNQAFYRNITTSNNELYRYYNSKNAGYSVRCVK